MPIILESVVCKAVALAVAMTVIGSNMTRSFKSILHAGLLVVAALASTCAQANMPTLTPKPRSPSPALCQKWAANQDEEALYMWGMQESGGSSNKVAVSRLASFCLGRKSPEIVGFGSSVGFDDNFCDKHRSAKICQNRQ